MCVMSATGDVWTEQLPQQYPWIKPGVTSEPWTSFPKVDVEELARLRKDMLKMRGELIKAKAKDLAEGNEDCTHAEKVALLKEIAELVNVDLSEVFG